MIEATPSTLESASTTQKHLDLDSSSEAHGPVPDPSLFANHAEGTGHDSARSSARFHQECDNGCLNPSSHSRKRIKVQKIQLIESLDGSSPFIPEQNCTTGEATTASKSSQESHISIPQISIKLKKISTLASKSRINRHRALQGFFSDVSRQNSESSPVQDHSKNDILTPFPGIISAHDIAVTQHSEAVAAQDGHGQNRGSKRSLPSKDTASIKLSTNSNPGRYMTDQSLNFNAVTQGADDYAIESSNASRLLLQESLQLISEALNSPIEQNSPIRVSTENGALPTAILDCAVRESVTVQNSCQQSFCSSSENFLESVKRPAEPRPVSDDNSSAIRSSEQGIFNERRSKISLRDCQYSSRRDAVLSSEDVRSSSQSAPTLYVDSSSLTFCEVPCKCQKCFFASKGSHLYQIFYPPRTLSDEISGINGRSSACRKERSLSSGFHSNESSANFSSSRSHSYHGWRQSNSRNHQSSYLDDLDTRNLHSSYREGRDNRHYHSSYREDHDTRDHHSSYREDHDTRDQHDTRNRHSSREVSPRRQSLKNSNIASSNNRHFSSSSTSRWDIRSSNSSEVQSCVYTHSRSHQSQRDAQHTDKKDSDDAQAMNSSASSLSKIPIKRVLSAAEKQAILANAKFSMKTPVITNAAIPRLDEDHRPRRPLVRPVYSSPSARLNIRPARLVAYRSETNRIKEDLADPDDELCMSLSDETQIVIDEDIYVIDEPDESDGGFRYIRYAKNRVGVQMISFSSPSTNITGKGIYCDMVFPRSRRSSLLPLPLALGAEMLNEKTRFKLPFTIAHCRLAEMELDELRRTGTFLTNPPPFFITNRNIRLPTTILPEYAGGDEILDCQCHIDIQPGCGSNCINRLTHVECEPDQCKFGDACTNQRFQKRQWSKLSVQYMGEKGWGLCLAQDVRQGDLIIEYVGELIDSDTCKERCRNEYRSEKHFYLLSLYKNIIIDATRRGNIGRFCNHSCEPSCETQKWSVRGSPRIGIFARRDLLKGTEVTLDYNFEQIGLAMTKCLCGSESCRGFLGVPKSKRRKELLPFGLDDYDIMRDGPPILHPDEQVLQMSEYLNLNQLPDAFLSMVSQIGSESLHPALLVRNVVRVHASFMDRLEYNPDLT